MNQPNGSARAVSRQVPAGRCLACMKTLTPADIRECSACHSPLPYVSKDSTLLEPGVVLKGRYQIGRPLGSGGFGNTYLAFDLASHSVCAVKEYFLRGAAVRDRKSSLVLVEQGREHAFKRFRDSFIKEAQQLSQLGAIPGMVRVFDVFQQNNTAYFAMSYVQGQTLRNWLLEQKAPQALNDVLAMVNELLDILGRVHARGILHRDVSMDNIIRGSNGELTLIDFGAARQAGKPEMTVYHKGVYTAPEQKLGVTQGPYTDIYAVGVIMFALLHGRLPHEDQNRLEPLPGLPQDIQAQLDRIFRKATHPRTSARYQQTAQMRAELQQVALRADGYRLSLSRPRRPLRGMLRTPKGSREIRLKILLAVFLFFLLLLLLAIVLGDAGFQGVTD